MMRKTTKSKTGKKAIFLLQFTENALKVIKYLPFAGGNVEFLACSIEHFSPGASDKDLSDLLVRTVRKLGYRSNQIVISLPRQQATCRYVKIPAHSPQEIEKIIAFQAPTYLPYPIAELITGYEIIETDKDGYSYVSVVIVHKAVAERYITICQALAAKSYTILLSSYGLCHLCNQNIPDAASCALVIDIDAAQTEIAIIARKKLIFSRSCRIMPNQNFATILGEEVEKTISACRKETGVSAPGEIAVLTVKGIDTTVVSALMQRTHLPVKAVKYLERINASEAFSKQIQNADISFANLMGLAMGGIPVSLNLAPTTLKQTQEKLGRRKETVRLAALSLAALIFFGISVAKTIHNKQKELAQLQSQLHVISKDVSEIENLEQRINFVQAQPYKSSSPLEVFYQLHQIMPVSVRLVHFDYEEDLRITLRGYTHELNGVVELVTQLEKSAVFKEFSVKVKYATKKKSQTTEGIDFQIDCLKKQ